MDIFDNFNGYWNYRNTIKISRCDCEIVIDHNIIEMDVILCTNITRKHNIMNFKIPQPFYNQLIFPTQIFCTLLDWLPS